MRAVTDITTRHALDRLYDKAQRIGRLEAHLDAMREVHRRILAEENDLGAFADWLSARVSEGLDAAARDHQ